MNQAKKLHQILYTEIRRVPQGQRIFLGELISGGGDQPPWPSWTEGMLAPYDCIVYERSEKMLDDRVVAAPTRVECDPKLTRDLDVAQVSIAHLDGELNLGLTLGQMAAIAKWGLELCAHEAERSIPLHMRTPTMREYKLQRAADLRQQARAGGTTE